jgi:two-component system sensor histidine kinase PilS (NtrC family)
VPERRGERFASAGSDARLQARLTRLMAARLLLLVAVFGAALVLQGGRSAGAWEGAEDGLFATLACAFLATLLLAGVLRRIRHPGTFVAIQVPIDAAIVTALIHFTGGDESLFGFLYVLVVVFGAIVARRAGAFGAAAACSVLHGALLAAEAGGVLSSLGAPSAGGPLLVVFWSVHSAALAVVALLGSHLSRELANADAELDASRSEVRRLRSHHERIVQSLLSGLLTTDRDGRITSFNPEAGRITGRESSDVVGLEIDEVIPGARSLVVTPPLMGGDLPNPRLRLAYVREGGAELHLGIAGSALRDADGESRGSVVIFQDVTRVVEMEAELRRNERLAAAGRLAADIAHEVRNPLAAISGSIQMMLSGGQPQSPENARLMEIVLRETDRLNELSTDFLQYAHPPHPKIEKVELQVVIDEMLQMVENSGVRVETATDIPSGFHVEADAAQLRQLLWNLCSNAVQAMPEGGALSVSAGPAGQPPQDERSRGRNVAEMEGLSWVEVRVSDSGVGIAPEDCDRIFDPFFTTKETGTGLGLATVHRIVEGHGGFLKVESAVGQGTTFRVVLPQQQGES